MLTKNPSNAQIISTSRTCSWLLCLWETVCKLMCEVHPSPFYAYSQYYAVLQTGARWRSSSQIALYFTACLWVVMLPQKNPRYSHGAKKVQNSLPVQLLLSHSTPSRSHAKADSDKFLWWKHTSLIVFSVQELGGTSKPVTPYILLRSTLLIRKTSAVHWRVPSVAKTEQKRFISAFSSWVRVVSW